MGKEEREGEINRDVHLRLMVNFHKRVWKHVGVFVRN